MHDEAQAADRTTGVDHDLSPIADDELTDEELCRQSSVKLCCGAPGCRGLCPVFPSGVLARGLDGEPAD